ncbi:MAG TPA: methylmalonyl-CoA epimerase [Phototrophicaceae bacterium]|jgi:methylmalonyl-CoA/ethylmalonyl-CoA epimerase|nr:methylmalonyl-CoA epimerase [Phototrophicaceae bacterium]
MTPIKVNHIAVIVADVDTALKFWRDALGLPLQHTAHIDSEAVDIAFLPVGDSEIELVAPTTDDSGVAKYLAKTGGGLHHICLEVEDLEVTMAQLNAHGIQLINETPRTHPDGRRYAFVHPKSAGGVMVELYEVLKQ